MATDVTKHLDRGKRYLEKNKLREAVTEYQSVLEAAPTHTEALQSLADIYTRLNEPGRAAYYHGIQFDRLVDAGDVAKASALFTRFLKTPPQPPDRLLRYALLLQKQNKVSEAIEIYTAASARFHEQRQAEDALLCLKKIAQLDPENAERHLHVAALAENLGESEVASHGCLRAGQLCLAAGDLDQALKLFGRAHELNSSDRTAALLYAEARLRTGDASSAISLLEPFWPNHTDTPFLAVLGESLLRTGQLNRAREVLEAYYQQKPDGFGKLFELASLYFKVDQDEKAVALLARVKEWMFGLRRDGEFATQLDRLWQAHTASLPLAEFSARVYEELNREAKYFDALVRLFDLRLEAGNLAGSCDALDRLVDIDPYDYRNHERIARLEGKVDPLFLRGVMARAAKAATAFVRPQDSGGGEPIPVTEKERTLQALDDLMVQVEIFLQYSLQAKAVERLERIAEVFPGEEQNNDRLRALYDRANWWPKGMPPKPKSVPQAETTAPAVTGPYNPAETHRDLAAIAEITRLMYRQTTPQEVLAAAVEGIGKYLEVTRCIVTVGPAGDPSQPSAEFSAGVAPAGPSGAGDIANVLKHLAIALPDSLGGIELRANAVPALRKLGLQTVLGVQLTDKETQTHAGLLFVGADAGRKWKSNENFFLQSIGDQLLFCVNHTKLRSLIRTLAVADEKTGLLSRGAYLDCLLAETRRAKLQNTPLSLVIVQVDRGPELLRQFGESSLDQYLKEVARALEGSVRQSDLAVKYTAWSIALILPATPLESARALAEKWRQSAAAVPPPWTQPRVTLSAVVAEVSQRPGDESEDRVTEWINRAEFGLDEARHHGGDTVLALAAPNS